MSKQTKAETNSIKEYEELLFDRGKDLRRQFLINYKDCKKLILHQVDTCSSVVTEMQLLQTLFKDENNPIRKKIFNNFLNIMKEYVGMIKRYTKILDMVKRIPIPLEDIYEKRRKDNVVPFTKIKTSKKEA